MTQPTDSLPLSGNRAASTLQFAHYSLSEYFALPLKAAEACGYYFEDFDKDVTMFDNPRYTLRASDISYPATAVRLENDEPILLDEPNLSTMPARDVEDPYADFDQLTSDLSSLASSMSLDSSNSKEPIPDADFLSDAQSSSAGGAISGPCGETSGSEMEAVEEPEKKGPFVAWRTLQLPESRPKVSQSRSTTLPLKKILRPAFQSKKKGKSNRRKPSKAEMEKKLQKLKEKEAQKRGGRRLRVEAGGSKTLAKDLGLRARTQVRSDAYINDGISMLEHGAASGGGWEGRTMPQEELRSLQEIWDTGDISHVVCNFEHIVYRENPTILLDCDGRCFCFRTEPIDFLVKNQQEFVEAIDSLLHATLDSEAERVKALGRQRGDHYPCIMGHARQYTSVPDATKWHKDHEENVNKFLATDIVQRVIRYVNRTVEVMFPGVAKRFKDCADWHKKKHGFEPLFGAFFQLCINGIFRGMEDNRIHCRPHLDFKNVVGICVLLVYQNPNKPFNHKRRSWLVLWEAGVAIELPPWVMLAYPSSLLHHFNVDLADFEFVTVEGDARPTRITATPLDPNDGDGRGSFVFFNQASLYKSSETGYNTLKEARIKGKHSGKTSYAEGLEQALSNYLVAYE